jgi:HD-like signal output (HDOD) protein
MKKRILFVDDEPDILNGLRDALWKQRAQWDMAFANSGAEALAQLDRRSFDVIVTDMRMPAMDGAELLTRVRERHPTVVRLSLSGQIDKEAVARALPVTQQFLSKPCDPYLLRAMLERVCNLQSLFKGDAIRNLVGKLEQLPAMPANWPQLSETFANPASGGAEVAAIIEQDTTLAAKTLQVANSACFGLRRPVTSILEAVEFTGLALIRALALNAGLTAISASQCQVDALLTDRQELSLRRALLVRELLQGSPLAEEGFTAALLADAGETLLALCSAERYAAVISAVRSGGRAKFLVEQEIFGVTHAEVGAYLFSLWGLPLDLIEVIANHHTPSRVMHDRVQVLAAVHFADAVTETRWVGSDDYQEQLDKEFTARTDVAGWIGKWSVIAADGLPATPLRAAG